MPNHFLKLTAYENLAFFSSLYSGEMRDIDQLLERVGLGDARDQKVENFSKGMKMRLNFIRALLNNPEVLFLDEPTSGLDPTNAKIMKELILEEREKGRTIFITTHNMQVADDLCDRVAFMVEGKIVELDKPEELKLKHGEKVVEVEYYKENTIETARFGLENLGKETMFLEIVKQHPIRKMHSQETSLEDVFVKVTGRRLL